MAIAYQSSTTAFNNGGSISSLTFSHTVSAGNNRILLVGVSAETGVSAITFGGVGLTKLDDNNFGNSNSVWYLIAPSVSTADIVVTFGGSGNLYPAVIAANFTDVNQSTPNRTVANSASNSNTGCTVSVTSETGDLVVDFNGNRSVGSGVFNPTPGSGGTDRAYINAGSITAISLATEAGASGTTTMDWTWSGNQYYAQIAFALIEDTSPPSSNYPITAAQGSFTLTGQSTLLKVGRKMLAAYATFTLAGQNALLKLGKGMSVTYGSFVLTGQSVLFHIAMRMLAAYTTFALTMQTVIMRYGKIMSASVGNFVLTGQDILLKLGWKIAAAYGSFALTGQNAALHYGRLMSAAMGSFVLTGQNVLLKLGWKMQAAYTTFTLTGQTVLLKVGRYISAAYGSFTLTGQDILFHIAVKMYAIYGTITLTGQTVLFAVNGLYVKWTNTIKNAVATITNRTKNSSTWTNRDKTL